MIREHIEIAVLEDFADELARAGAVRVCTYDHLGELICASASKSPLGVRTGRTLGRLPLPLRMTQLPADRPPASVAFIEDRGVWSVVAPVRVHEQVVGYVAIGEMRDPRAAAPADVASDAQHTEAWQALPPLDRSAESSAVRLARWASRMLSEWCRIEDQHRTTARELTFIADLSEMLGGERDLQTLLDRIVAETARVMKCRYCSLRLYDAAKEELTVVAVHNLGGGYVSSDVRRRAAAPVDDEALRGRTVYIEDAQTDSRVPDRAHAKQLGIVSGLVTGVFHHGKPIGVLRVYADHRVRFRTAQRNLLRAVAAQAAVAIVNARLLEDRIRAAELQRQIELAGQVQSRMIRARGPDHPRVLSAIVFEPSSHVGGDFCDVFTLPDGRFGAAIGDVVGHGVPAALLMASVRGALRALVDSSGDLAEILTRLNRQVHGETTSGEFVSMLLVAIDPDRGVLTYCSAGHEPPLRVRNGAIERFDDGGLVLGLLRDERYHASQAPIADGDTFLLYTDGVVEAMDFEGRAFGRDRLAESLITHASAPIDQTLRQIRWDIRRFVGLAEQSDDLTMVGLRQQPALEPR